jgi:hypothetical protein
MRFSRCASVENALNSGHVCMLVTRRCHSAHDKELSSHQGISDTVVNLREQRLDWVLKVIRAGHIGVTIRQLNWINARVSMVNVLNTFSNCDPIIAQEIVVQCQGVPVGESSDDQLFPRFLAIDVIFESTLLFILHAYHVGRNDVVGARGAWVCCCPKWGLAKLRCFDLLSSRGPSGHGGGLLLWMGC